MLFELTLCLICGILLWDYLVKQHRYDLLKQSNITGPKTYPIVGNAFALRNLDTEHIIEFAQNKTRKYGKVYRIWVFHQLSVFVSDPKYLEIILSSQHLIKKSSIYDFVVDWLGQGLLLSYGRKWHSRRKITTPSFHFKILEQFVEVFDQQSAVMVEKLYEKADGKTVVNIFPIVCLAALDIIAETAMGVKVNAQAKPDLEYVQALAYVTRIMAQRFINPSQSTALLFRLTSPREYKETQRCIGIMHKFTVDVIETRRAALEETIKNGTYENTLTDLKYEYGSKRRMALLDVLLQSTLNGETLSNEDIREEVDTFMFGGHDTTTSAISFGLYLISRRPNVQTKLVQEIAQVLGADKNKPVSYRELQDLKYMECVIKETLRLYPPVPAIGRKITEDVVLDDITLPANTNLSLSFFLVMRDPEYFPDPDVFKPERFAATESAECDNKFNPFAYTPFSAGPRNCIGQKYAMLEMKSTISKMLRHYELLPLGTEVRPIVNIILRSATGVNIGLKPRVF